MTKIEALEARISLHEENGHTHVLPMLYQELHDLRWAELSKNIDSTEPAQGGIDQ